MDWDWMHRKWWCSISEVTWFDPQRNLAAGMGMDTIPPNETQLYKLCHYPFFFDIFSCLIHHIRFKTGNKLRWFHVGNSFLHYSVTGHSCKVHTQLYSFVCIPSFCLVKHWGTWNSSSGDISAHLLFIRKKKKEMVNAFFTSGIAVMDLLL